MGLMDQALAAEPAPPRCPCGNARCANWGWRKPNGQRIKLCCACADKRPLSATGDGGRYGTRYGVPVSREHDYCHSCKTAAGKTGAAKSTAKAQRVSQPQARRKVKMELTSGFKSNRLQASNGEGCDIPFATERSFGAHEPRILHAQHIHRLMSLVPGSSSAQANAALQETSRLVCHTDWDDTAVVVLQSLMEASATHTPEPRVEHDGETELFFFDTALAHCFLDNADRTFLQSIAAATGTVLKGRASAGFITIDGPSQCTQAALAALEQYYNSVKTRERDASNAASWIPFTRAEIPIFEDSPTLTNAPLAFNASSAGASSQTHDGAAKKDSPAVDSFSAAEQQQLADKANSLGICVVSDKDEAGLVVTGLDCRTAAAAGVFTASTVSTCGAPNAGSSVQEFAEPDPPVHVFIDNNNIHWGIQTLIPTASAGDYQYHPGQRCTINIEGLTSLVENGRSIQTRAVAGSCPPRTSKIWTAYESCGYETFISARIPNNVPNTDEMLQGLAFKKLLEIPQGQKHTFVLLTGDGNLGHESGSTTFLDVVRLAVRSGHNVEIHSWAKCCNKAFYAMAAVHPSVTVHELDEHASRITRPIRRCIVSSPQAAQVHDDEEADLLGLMCPLTLDVFTDPVFTADGLIYDRPAIQSWFDKDHCTSPMTGLPLAHLRLQPAVCKQREMRAHQAKRHANQKQNKVCCPTFPLRMKELDPSVTERDLFTLFTDYMWAIDSVSLNADSRTAFINFSKEQDQVIAHETLSGMLWKGVPIKFSQRRSLNA